MQKYERVTIRSKVQWLDERRVELEYFVLQYVQSGADVPNFIMKELMEVKNALVDTVREASQNDNINYPTQQKMLCLTLQSKPTINRFHKPCKRWE